MMGQCPVCGGYVVYFCGASLALDEDVIGTHSLHTISNHILACIDEFLEWRVVEFLEEFADEFEIEYDIEPESPRPRKGFFGVRKDPREKAKSAPSPTRRSRTRYVKNLPAPSRRNPSAPPISAADLRDFRAIDLDGDRINTPENWS